MERAINGFTLIETLVALVIFTVVVMALQQSHVIGLRSIQDAHMTSAALDLARMKLAGAGGQGPLSEDIDEHGDVDRYQWRIAAQKYVAPESVSMPSQLTGYWVTVTVSWRDRPARPPRSVHLKSLKLQALP
jgi:prepilin-type N-terminal cleavage/methylation domain-containing protein